MSYGAAGISSRFYLFELELTISLVTYHFIGVLIDSGTTTTIFKESLEKPFHAAFKKATNFEWTDLGLPLTSEEVEGYPTILLQLEAADPSADPVPGAPYAGDLDNSNPMDILVAIPPTSYWKPHLNKDEGKIYYRPHIYFTHKTSSVLGANFLLGHDVYFDPQNQRIGIAESHCGNE